MHRLPVYFLNLQKPLLEAAPEWGFQGYAWGFQGYAWGFQGYAWGFQGYAIGR